MACLVELSRNKTDERKYAVKVIDTKRIGYSVSLREVKSFTQLCHPNIVRYNTSWTEQAFANIAHIVLKTFRINYVFIQMEYCEGGSLRGALERCEFGADANKAWKFVYQTICGLHFIHEHGFIHRDIKPVCVRGIVKFRKTFLLHQISPLKSPTLAK